MVVKVYGKCEGAEILFTRNPDGGRWETTVPATESGVYIIELWAEDEAGNVAYFATIKVAYDTSKLCTTIVILDVGAAFTVEDVQEVLSGQIVRTGLVDDPVLYGLQGDILQSAITRCEVCGR